MNEWLGKERAPGMAQRQNHFLVIPLCHLHHTGDHGIDSGMGVVRWEMEFGEQWGHLMMVGVWVVEQRISLHDHWSYDIWSLAGLPNPAGMTSSEYRENLRNTTSTEKGNE